jgi:dTDP-4-amino-4,6-dideoxygalactose transaminase
MASVVGTFVPTYQGLSPAHVARLALSERRQSMRATPYPFNAPRRVSYYRARNAIYHLFRALVEAKPSLTVLAPDYYSGNEIMAVQAAGARVHYCPIGPDMLWEPGEVERLCRRYSPDLLYVIHYAGWPQPVGALADLCRRREMVLFEDCALSLLSTFADGTSQGTVGHWSVFCLYKTLPLPNGALLVQNDRPVESLERLKLRRAGSASVAGRMAELFVQRLRGRSNGVGAALAAVKRGMGAAAGALDVRRANVGDIGFNLHEVDLAMSPISERLIARLDYDDIRRRRIANYQQLASELMSGADPGTSSVHRGRSAITPLFPVLPEGVCPLFFPVFVPNKGEAAAALRKRGVDVIEFWNDPVGDGGEMATNARLFRAHVLELPIHQDLGPRHISHIARQVSSLATRMAA